MNGKRNGAPVRVSAGAAPCKVCLTMGSLPAVAVRAKRELCADVSDAAHEDLAATASRVDRWVLIEYRGLWDRDVLGGSLLSQPLKEHLRDQLRKLGHSRLLFVKRPERRSYKRRMLYVGSCRPGEERFYGARVRPSRRPRRLRLRLGASRREHAGRPGRAPALRGLHAREARPLLREVRAAALRPAEGQGRPRMGLAVDARGRRPLRGQRRRPPRRAFLRPSRRGGPRPDPRRLLRRDASTSSATAAAPPTRSACRRPSSRSARRRASQGCTTSSSPA